MAGGGVLPTPGFEKIKGGRWTVARFFLCSTAFTSVWLAVSSQLGYYRDLHGWVRRVRWRPAAPPPAAQGRAASAARVATHGTAAPLGCRPQVLLQLNIAYFLVRQRGVGRGAGGLPALPGRTNAAWCCAAVNSPAGRVSIPGPAPGAVAGWVHWMRRPAAGRGWEWSPRAALFVGAHTTRPPRRAGVAGTILGRLVVGLLGCASICIAFPFLPQKIWQVAPRRARPAMRACACLPQPPQAANTTHLRRWLLGSVVAVGLFSGIAYSASYQLVARFANKNVGKRGVLVLQLCLVAG